MTTIAFDTGAFQGVHDKAELATQQELQIKLAPLKADLTLVKWMLGLMLGVVRHCSLRPTDYPQRLSYCRL